MRQVTCLEQALTVWLLGGDSLYELLVFCAEFKFHGASCWIPGTLIVFCVTSRMSRTNSMVRVMGVDSFTREAPPCLGLQLSVQTICDCGPGVTNFLEMYPPSHPAVVCARCGAGIHACKRLRAQGDRR